VFDAMGKVGARAMVYRFGKEIGPISGPDGRANNTKDTCDDEFSTLCLGDCNTGSVQLASTKLSDMRLWKRALTCSEMSLTNYWEGPAVNSNQVSTNTDIVAWYR
jgi:hypothetical protein